MITLTAKSDAPNAYSNAFHQGCLFKEWAKQYKSQIGGVILYLETIIETSGMQAVVYYLTLPFIYIISLMPFWLLYRVSDFLYLLIYRVLGYRKNVVALNLKNSFPNKSEKELKNIQRKFYVFLFDVMVETFKTLTISKKSLRKRVILEDLSIFEKYYTQKQSIVVVMGHYGNWELGGARVALEPVHKLNVVYHPLSNKHFDKLFYKMRSRLGNGLYSMKNTLRGMVADRKEITATALIADQTPSKKGAYWMQFLNQDTPTFPGSGKIPNKFGYPVIYASVQRYKRGFYKVVFEELVPNPKEVDPEEIVARFTRRLEQDIISCPETWLWSHRRWKHKRDIENISH